MYKCIITEILLTVELIEQKTNTSIFDNAKLHTLHRLWQYESICDEYYLKELNNYVMKWV
jgi:hypothetical protein